MVNKPFIKGLISGGGTWPGGHESWEMNQPPSGEVIQCMTGFVSFLKPGF